MIKVPKLQHRFKLLPQPALLDIFIIHQRSTHDNMGSGTEGGLISTALSASLTRSLINDLRPPKAAPVRIAAEAIICRAGAAAFDSDKADKGAAQR